MQNANDASQPMEEYNRSFLSQGNTGSMNFGLGGVHKVERGNYYCKEEPPHYKTSALVFHLMFTPKVHHFNQVMQNRGGNHNESVASKINVGSANSV